jgi:cellulose synthase/poly-beta-1,6-N-acetylglucosamine synthase-like glycosyltransferase
MINTILYIIFLVFFCYAAVSVLYILTLSLAGKWFYRTARKGAEKDRFNRIALLVPAYREDGIIMSTVNNLMQLDYPREYFDIYVIADKFQPATIQQLRTLPIFVFEVSFEKSTKTKSLNEAFKRITKPYDIALICDADNMMATNFLTRINETFTGGARAVQGRRVAKNLDSSFAILDACSEAINNHIFRKGTYGLGLSSAVIGSGMAFEYETVRQVLSEIHAVGGFDKILQLKVIEQGRRIVYLEDALVFDEKVDSSEAFSNQRKRWISSQFIYLKQFIGPAIKQLFKGNISYFNLAVMNNIVLPRAFLLLGLPLLAIAGYFVNNTWGMMATGVWVAYMLALVIALPPVLINRDLFQALLKLPKAILLMVAAVFQVKKSNKTFIHTVHTKTEVSNTIYNDQGK